MEEMDKRKKDRIIKGVVLNIFVFIGCMIYTFFFVVPKYDDIDILTEKVNNTIASLSSLKKDGVDENSFVELIARLWKKKEVSDIVFSDVEKLGVVLKKPTTVAKDYLSWLIEENGKINALDKEIQENDAILGNIIPVFVSPSSTNMDSEIAEQITLASFVSYIEKDILGKYALVSYSPIGISNISFPDKKDTPVNIGSFKIALDFKGKNSDILSMVDALQKSGKLVIRGGKIISGSSMITPPSKEKSLSQLSNLLVGINSFSLDSIPTVASTGNKGSIILEFYVEGMNYQKILMLRSLLSLKFEWLQKSIKEKGFICAKAWNSLCNETLTANAIVAIKNLSKNLATLKPQIDAFKKGGLVIDVNKEMDTLFDLKGSLESIEITYLQNNSILEKAKKQSSNK